MLDAVAPDLVVLDWDLTVIGAPEIVRLLQDSHVDRRTPPVVVTMARPRRSEVERAVALGLSNVVAKPFSAKSLHTHLSAACLTAF
ncbi:MAG: response regulator receiver protein [Enterovirga sp.]|nr:response regulator receiver protein [Enterovirga sp.]